MGLFDENGIREMDGRTIIDAANFDKAVAATQLGVDAGSAPKGGCNLNFSKRLGYDRASSASEKS